MDKRILKDMQRAPHDSPQEVTQVTEDLLRVTYRHQHTRYYHTTCPVLQTRKRKISPVFTWHGSVPGRVEYGCWECETDDYDGFIKMIRREECDDT